MVLMVQSKKLSGYQSMSLILGFWCAHWLIYDWGWYAYSYAVGEIPDLSAFWQSTFSTPLFIPNPPYWLFLTIAILGGIMAFYTFTIPKRRRHLIPPMIWLYAAYINASICGMTGLNPTGILIVGLILVSVAFGLMGYFTIQRLLKGLPNWLKDTTSKRKWLTSDPLGLPLIFAMVAMLIIMPLFLTINPTVGLFLGMIPWFFLPMYYILIHSTGVAKRRGTPKVLIVVSLTALFIAFVVVLSILPIDSLI
jgi:hypothetical protein